MDSELIQSKKIRSTIKKILSRNKLSEEDRYQWQSILKIKDFLELKDTYLAYKDFYKEKTLGHGLTEDNDDELALRHAYRRGTGVKFVYHTPRGDYIEIAHVARAYSITWDEAAIRFVKESNGFYILDKILISGIDLDILQEGDRDNYEIPSKGEWHD